MTTEAKISNSKASQRLHHRATPHQLTLSDKWAPRDVIFCHLSPNLSHHLAIQLFHLWWTQSHFAMNNTTTNQETSMTTRPLYHSSNRSQDWALFCRGLPDSPYPFNYGMSRSNFSIHCLSVQTITDAHSNNNKTNHPYSHKVKRPQ